MVNPDLLPFPADEFDTSPPRWIVMDGRDVRTHLANGVVPGPVDTRPFAAELNPPDKGWRLIDPFNHPTPIPVRSAKHACLVRLDHRSVREGEEFLTEEQIPASLIAAIAFQTEQTGNDWSVRTRSFPGLPHSLPEIETIDGNIEFCDAEIEDDGAPKKKSAAPSERDRVAATFTTILNSMDAVPDTMSVFAELEEMPDQIFLAGVLARVAGQEPETIQRAMEILADPSWAGGFDPIELLAALASGLTSRLDAETVEPWATYVGEVLNNTRQDALDSLLDEGDILLRALQLLLRSTPLSVAEIEKQLAIRGDAVGQRVGELSLALAGWYEGFGDLTGPAKEQPAIYSIGSRVAVGSNQYPLEFAIEDAEGPDLELVTALHESGQPVCSHILRPTPEFLAAYRTAESVCSERGWAIEYDRSNESMSLSVDEQEITATVTPDGELAWRATMVAGKRKGARKWLEYFLMELLRVAARFRCLHSSPQGYPELELHSNQHMGSLAPSTVSQHIQAIVDATRLVKEIPADPKKAAQDRSATEPDVEIPTE